MLSRIWARIPGKICRKAGRESSERICRNAGKMGKSAEDGRLGKWGVCSILKNCRKARNIGDPSPFELLFFDALNSPDPRKRPAPQFHPAPPDADGAGSSGRASSGKSGKVFGICEKPNTPRHGSASGRPRDRFTICRKILFPERP